MRWVWLVFTCVSAHAQIELRMLEVWSTQHKEGLAAGDRAVDQVWQKVQARGLNDPSFVEGATEVAEYYRVEGYELKAERILQKAIAAAERADEHATWQLMEDLADHYKKVQQSVKAAYAYGRIAGELRKHVDYQDMRQRVLLEYGRLKDRMGDLAEAEALLTELSGLNPDSSIPLAQFYSSHGRVEESEDVLKRALGDPSISSSGREAAFREYIDLLNNQHRYDETAGMMRALIKLLEQSLDEYTRNSATQQKEVLALMLGQHGQTQESAELLQQIVDTEAGRHGNGSSEHVQALLKAGMQLTGFQEFEAAEKYVQRSIDLGSTANRQAAYEQMALLRDLQKRGADAEQFRQMASAKGSAEQRASPAIKEPDIEDYVNQAQAAINESELDNVMPAIRAALTLAASQPPSHPREIAEIAQTVPLLVSRNRKDDAIRVLREITAAIELRFPADHPRVAMALAALGPAYDSLGWTTEFERILDRAESILISAMGPDSPSLNQIGNVRMMRFRRVGDNRAAVLESQTMLARTEAAQGANSEMAMESLHQLAATLQAGGDWQSAKAVLQDLLHRSERARGTRSEEHRRLVDEVAQIYALHQGRNNGHLNH